MSLSDLGRIAGIPVFESPLLNKGIPRKPVKRTKVEQRIEAFEATGIVKTILSWNPCNTEPELLPTGPKAYVIDPAKQDNDRTVFWYTPSFFGGAIIAPHGILRNLGS